MQFSVFDSISLNIIICVGIKIHKMLFIYSLYSCKATVLSLYGKYKNDRNLIRVVRRSQVSLR